MTTAMIPAVTVEAGGKVVRGLAVPFHRPAYVLHNGDVIEEMFDEESIDRLPCEIPLLVSHRRDQPPVGVVRSSAIIGNHGVGVEAELVGGDDELEGWGESCGPGSRPGCRLGSPNPGGRVGNVPPAVEIRRGSGHGVCGLSR